MIKLKKIICHLDKEVYKNVEKTLEKNKAANFLYLLQTYRNSEADDVEVAKTLDISSHSLYVLKSYLNDKIQEHLSGDLFSSREQILKQLQLIQEVCLGNNREIAITFLKKLETELLFYGMHTELMVVYSTLKKMHLHSEKYFQYSQLYNQHVAFSLSLEKCEEILGNFNYVLGQYNFSRSPKLLDTLFFLNGQVQEHFTVNPSRLTEIIMNIMKLQLRIFTPAADQGVDTEEMLNATQHLVSELPGASVYKKWIHVIDFLAFEYYNKIGQKKMASLYFSKVDGMMGTILLYSHVAMTSRFLVSRLNYLHGQENIRHPEKLLYDSYDIHTSIHVAVYEAMLAYFKDDYKDAVHRLNTILNTNSFKDFFHISADLKLTLAYIHIKMEAYTLADSLMRSIVRKVKSESSLDYPNIFNIINVFNSEIRQVRQDWQARQKKDFSLFLAKNTNDKELLVHLLPELKKKYLSISVNAEKKT